MSNLPPSPSKAIVLAGSLKNCSNILCLSTTTQAAILHVNQSQLSRLLKVGIEPDSKSGELALSQIRIYRRVYALMGGNSEHIKHWINSENSAFDNQSPIERMVSIEGIADVFKYCETFGKN